MGAHSLGKASREDNGFDGVWTPGQETAFNVTYYQNMVAKNLTYQNVVTILAIIIFKTFSGWKNQF